LLRQIQGNARYGLLFEPMFLIPYHMVITYASIYMLHMGLSNSQIGLVATIGSALQVFTALISGYVTDRLGRRKTLLIFDLLSWSVPALLWMVSDHFLYFVVAAAINSLVKIPANAFYCLLIEDTPVPVRSKVFSILQFTSAAGGVFAPLAALVIVHYDLVTSVRLMYAFFFLSTTFMFVSRHYFLYDTAISVKKMAETGGETLRTILTQYRITAAALFRNRAVRPFLMIYVMFYFQLLIKNTFLSIYMLDRLQFEATMIAWFPAVSSLSMLAALYFIVPRLDYRKSSGIIAIGLMMTVISYVLLLVSPVGSFAVITLSTIFHSMGTLLIQPFLESYLASRVNDDERARFYAILTVCMMLFTSPAGILGGWTYGIQPQLPFLLILTGLVICMAVMLGRFMRKDKTIVDVHT
jgi:DHA1 family tetracycline resistance protein-like MFS transporter